MNELFVSYSRKDTDFARHLTEQLKAEGLESWVDWRDIPPSVDWMNEIKRGIEEANIFLFLVSPDSIASSICAEELAHGVLNGKRIIPVIVREIEVETAPKSITHLNWIFFSRPRDDFDSAFEKLLAAIRTDYDWVQVQKRMQVKALEWERSDDEESLLLRGKDLEDAEAQFKVNGQKPPRPTDVQLQYLEKSRTEENRRIEEQRAREQQLEIEKTVGSRSRRLTYIMLAIFTVAFGVLYFWLYRLITDMSLTALKNQMIAIVESTSVTIDGDEFHMIVNNYSAGSADAKRDPYFTQVESILTKVKDTNTHIDPNMSLYLLTRGQQTGKIQVIASADQEYNFKDTLDFNGEQFAQFLGLSETSTDFEISNNNFGDRNLISACTPIRDGRSTSVGALCTDFHMDIVYETQSNVARTLGIAFLAVYPLMVILVVITTRSLSRRSISAKKM